MKNRLIPIMATLMVLLCGCGAFTTAQNNTSAIDENNNVELNVVTMYAGDDINSENYKLAVEEWKRLTGYRVSDNSVTADEAFKKRVIKDFQAGAEPDILFYFNGADSNPLVQGMRVVSLESIRSNYPDYASNMKEEMMPKSPVDGRIYSVPVNGYWEGLYVNKTVCEKAGVKIPDENTTWNEFMDICEKIKDKGYIPIAASLYSVPHYWFEFCIYNHQNSETHGTLPQSIDDEYGQAWVKGIYDIKDMYERGLFPEDTLTATDDATMNRFLNGEAAFLLDGSWRLAQVEEGANNPEDYMITFVPGMGERKATDIVSGLSTGYFITMKAWKDTAKREAAISFVEYMTSDKMVSLFAKASATALASGVIIDEDECEALTLSGLRMAEKATGTAEAVQDYIPLDARDPIFKHMPDIVTGKISVEEAVSACLEGIYK